MPRDVYQIKITPGGRFDDEFRNYAALKNHDAARLLTDIERFATWKSPGELVRSRNLKEVYAIPDCDQLRYDGAAGILVERCTSLKTVEPIRFLPPNPNRDWDEVIRWVERYLRI